MHPTHTHRKKNISRQGTQKGISKIGVSFPNITNAKIGVRIDPAIPRKNRIISQFFFIFSSFLSRLDLGQV